jgi:hypothetical protein
MSQRSSDNGRITTRPHCTTKFGAVLYGVSYLKSAVGRSVKAGLATPTIRSLAPSPQKV